MEQIKDWFGKELTVAVGTDHGGFELKKELLAALAGKNMKILDCGPYELDPSDDYPDFSNEAAKAVSLGKADCAVLICRSGIGMSINANRYNYVRAALVTDVETAVRSREHNCSNVLVLAGDKLDAAAMLKIVEAWFAAPYSNEGRHTRRLEKIEEKSYDDIAAVRKADPEIAAMIDREAARQRDGIELIASENFTSCAVRAAQGSVLTNKYAKAIPENVIITVANLLTKLKRWLLKGPVNCSARKQPTFSRIPAARPIWRFILLWLSPAIRFWR